MNHQVLRVGQATLETYLLNEDASLRCSRRRPTVIVCPGGAYSAIADREAEPVAMRFLAAGAQALLLRYSVAPARYPQSALELAQAVRLARQNADAWHIDPNRVFVCGFSAGGHLCATLGNLWDEPLFHQHFGREDADWRPDGMILCYALLSMSRYAHAQSLECLLGANPPRELCEALSMETRASAKTVPAFLWHTGEDTDVPAEQTLEFALGLRRSGTPFELHLYERGVHGLSLCDETSAYDDTHVQPDNTGWMAAAVRWMNRH